MRLESEISMGWPIVLLGMMGSGKTSVGKKLAEFLGIEFYDTDKIIEQETGRTVQEIFAQEGEALFRQYELEVIEAYVVQTRCVIATGGGAVTIPEAMDVISNKAVSIWLKSDIPVLLSRLKDNKTRPLLLTDRPEAKLTALLNERKSLYARAHIHIDNPSDNIDSVVQNILNELPKLDES